MKKNKLISMLLVLSICVATVFTFVGCAPVAQQNTTSVSKIWQAYDGAICATIKNNGQEIVSKSGMPSVAVDVGMSVDGGEYLWLGYGEARIGLNYSDVSRYVGKTVKFSSRLRAKSEGAKEYLASEPSQPVEYTIKEYEMLAGSVSDVLYNDAKEVILSGTKAEAEKAYFLRDGDKRDNYLIQYKAKDEYMFTDLVPANMGMVIYKITWATDDSWTIAKANNFEYHLITSAEYADNLSEKIDSDLSAYTFLPVGYGEVRYHQTELIDTIDSNKEEFKTIAIIIRTKASDTALASGCHLLTHKYRVK